MRNQRTQTGVTRGAGPTRIDLGGGAVGFVESSTVVPLVSIVVSLRTGSTSDPEGKDGLCRMTMRMLRRGCASMEGPEIESAVDRLGAELSVEVGPSTTSVHGQVIRRNVGPFVDLLAKLLSTPTFAEDELARLRRESVAELVDSRDNDRALASIAFRRALFPGHPYSRGAAGRASTLEGISRDDVVSAYRRHMVRGDLVIGFAGAVTADEAKELGGVLASAVGDGPRSTGLVPEPPVPEGRRLYFVDKPERTQTQILIGTLGTWPHDDDHVPLVTAMAVFGGTFTSRMMKEIRSKRGWSYGTSARLSLERRRHAFTMGAFPASADCAPCLALEIGMLEELVTKGITPRELGFIRNYLVRSHAFEVDTAPKRLGQVLEVELLGLPADYHDSHLDHVRAVTLEGANQSLTKRISPDRLVIVVVGTASEILDKVCEAIPNLAGHEVLPFDRD